MLEPIRLRPLSYSLGAELENLVLTGSSTINATGNELANALTGNAGNNLLDGRAGADRMTGGSGNVTYLVDDTGDKVIEGANGGIDTVKSSVPSRSPPRSESSC